MELTNTAEFRQYIGGTAACTSKIMKAKKDVENCCQTTTSLIIDGLVELRQWMMPV